MMTKSQHRRFVVCVKAEAGIDLELRRVYEVLPDESAARDDFIRVIDESGDDYLYPASYFVSVDVSEESAEALHAAAQTPSGAAG